MKEGERSAPPKLEMIASTWSSIRKVLPELATVLATVLVLSFCHRLISSPWIGTYRVGDDKKTTVFHDSLGFQREGAVAVVEGTVTLPYLYPTAYRIIPDNCLVDLTINDKPVREGLPLCDYNNGSILQLREYLHTGSNTFKAVVRNDGGPGGLAFALAPWEGLPLALISLSVLAVAACLWSAARKLGIQREPLTFVWFFGVAVRLLYLIATPVSARSYDFYGHREYIFYVLNHFAIPPPRGGWEFYQSPFYYFFVATILAPFKWFGFDERFLLNVAQGISFLLSSAALAVGIWVGRILWREPKDAFYRIGFGVTLAVLPGLVMFSSRISNDAMMPLVGFLFLALLLRWYESGERRFWDASIWVLGLAVLTKGSALAFIPIALLSVVLKNGSARVWRERRRLLARAGLTFALLVGWYVVYRVGIQGEGELISSIDGLDKSLGIKVSPETFLSVDPLSVIQHPYNENRIDGFGRDRMWSYLTKSVFLGEWNFGSRVNGIMGLVHGMNFFIFLPLALIAMTRDLLSRKLVPLWTSLLMPLGAMMAAVNHYPFGNIQDFRFVPIITLPVTHYLLAGITLLPQKISAVVKGLLMFFWALCLLVLHGIVVSG